VSTSQLSLEILVEGRDHTRVDPGLSFDPLLILNTPELISPSTVVHEHQVIDDHVDLVVLISAG